MKNEIKHLFAKDLCSDKVLKKFMRARAFKNYLKQKNAGVPLDAPTLNSLAFAMKKWAIKNGATHYCHHFFPLLRNSGEKYISFLDLTSDNKYIDKFDGSCLKTEVDASSFPSSTLCPHHRARGFVVWDGMSAPFLYEKSGQKILYIPSLMFSRNGECLDEKTPLLRALEHLNEKSLKVLHLLGHDAKKTICNIGCEQEFFLIDEKHFDKRLDLKCLGKTVLGKECIKPQRLFFSYCQTLHPDEQSFFDEVCKKLYRLGIRAKIFHKEGAALQFEIVPIFEEASIAFVSNEIIMAILCEVATKYKKRVTFCEKPFADMSGSGKHINISFSTDDGINLFDINCKNRQMFLLYFSTFLMAIKNNAKLIELISLGRNNELRLGGSEAPPNEISVCLGRSVKEIKNFKTAESFYCGIKNIPPQSKEFCNRNRTSPIVYAGGKFEFRLIGASQRVAFPITCVAVAFARELEKIEKYLIKNGNESAAISKLINDNFDAVANIIFEGDCYERKFNKIEQKQKTDFVSAFDFLSSKTAIHTFDGVLSENELCSIKTEKQKYECDLLSLEIKVVLQMLCNQLLPKVFEFLTRHHNPGFEQTFIQKALPLAEKLFGLAKKLSVLNKKLEKYNDLSDKEKSNLISRIKASLEKISGIEAMLETYLPEDVIPFPTHNDIFC